MLQPSEEVAFPAAAGRLNMRARSTHSVGYHAISAFAAFYCITRARGGVWYYYIRME